MMMVKIFWNERGSLVNHVRTYWTQIYVRIEDCLSITWSICLRNCSALDICWSEVIVMFIKDILRARPRIKQGLSPLVIVHDRLLSWNDWHCNIVATVSNDGGQLYMIILNFVMNLGVDDQVFWWASLGFFLLSFSLLIPITSPRPHKNGSFVYWVQHFLYLEKRNERKNGSSLRFWYFWRKCNWNKGFMVLVDI